MSISRVACACLAALFASTSAWAVAGSFDDHRARAISLGGTEACPLPEGWNAVAARNPRFVIFGETHGTQQAPAFVGDVACALAVRGKRILVAVEHSSTDDAAFQAAWRLPAAQFSEAMKRAGWAGRNDGVASEAMLILLERLHQLARSGLSIDIVAFNGAKGEAQGRRFAHLPGQGPHEAAQAENIRVAAAARPYDHVLVLVGSLHAKMRVVQHSGATFETMAMRLGPPPAVVSLHMETAGGTAWNCQLTPGMIPEPGKRITSEDLECAAHPISGHANLRRKPFIALGALPGADPNPDYDGVFWLGTVSGSPPAVKEPGSRESAAQPFRP